MCGSELSGDELCQAQVQTIVRSIKDVLESSAGSPQQRALLLYILELNVTYSK